MKKITSLALLAMSGAFLLASCGEQPAASSSHPTGLSTDSASTPAAQQITVKFNTDGGSAIADVKIDKGTKVTKPADPTKEGYTFGKWYEDATKVTEYDFDTVLSADITLYASWIAAAPSSSDSSEPEPADPSTLYFRDDYFWNNLGAVTLVKFDEGEWGAVTHVQWVPVESQSVGYNYWSVQIPEGAVTVTFLRSYQGDTTYGGPHTPTLTLADRGTNNMYDIYKESKTWPGDGATVEGVWGTYDGSTPAPTPSGSDSSASSVTPSGETVAITIAKTGMPEWWTNNDPLFLVWAWGGHLDTGMPFAATAGEEAFTANIPSDATGIQLLRCSPDAAEVIHWSGSNKNVWNKTNAIDFSASTTSYSVTNWNA